MVISDKISVNETLKWVHKGISNLKKNLPTNDHIKIFTELPQ